LALAEQVKLFSNANAIVGPHGAGLTNLLYSLKGSFIGEIQTSDVANAHYLVMSQQLGMRFDRFKADAIPLGENQVDMRVDAQFLAKWVSTCLDR
jgi:capsular polysaccharide biosynthesis protein